MGLRILEVCKQFNKKRVASSTHRPALYSSQGQSSITVSISSFYFNKSLLISNVTSFLISLTVFRCSCLKATCFLSRRSFVLFEIHDFALWEIFNRLVRTDPLNTKGHKFTQDLCKFINDFQSSLKNSVMCTIERTL